MSSLELVPQFPPVVTSSLRALFNSCHQKFYNETILGLKVKGLPNVHLNAGAAYASCLEAFRKSFFSTGNYDDAVAEGFLALVKAYGAYDPPEGETKTFERMVATFVEYLFRYPPMTDHVKPLLGFLGPTVEFSFTFEVPECFHPVTNDPILFGGTLDQLCEFNSAYFIFDDKTTGAMGPQWKRQWDLRSQFTGYVAGLQSARPDIADKIMGAIIRGMGILKTEIKSEEVITYRPQWMVDRWKTRLVWDIKRMIQCWKDGYWPQTGEESGACNNYGICQFHTVCSSKFPETFMAVEYEVSRWDPIKKEREK